ncbi:Sex hormone-binding globulin, partial [Ophiophagus hannah]
AVSSFDFRTFDPEGVIFYGDTGPGDDWFILALRRGKPIVQIHNTLTNITITVKNEGHFIMLLVDGDDQLTLSHVSHPIVNQPTPQMRIGVGGLFILPNELLLPDLTAELGNQTVLLLPLPEGGCLDSPLLLRLTSSSFTLRLGDTEISKPTPKAEFESLQQLWLSNMGSLVI